MKLYISRHGQTPWNVEDLVCGRADVPLTEVGLQQAKLLAESALDKNIDVILCSPLLRARQTAQAVSDAIGVPIQIDDRLVEFDFGSLDGQMVNIDGNGKRVGMIVYGPKNIIVVAGMNKVCATLEDAVKRARTVAAPMNQQRFALNNPCTCTGVCADCHSESSICNQLLITRNSKPAGRIKFVLVGEELGF